LITPYFSIISLKYIALDLIETPLPSMNSGASTEHPKPSSPFEKPRRAVFSMKFGAEQLPELYIEILSSIQIAYSVTVPPFRSLL
jgi:hypothetical protein